ncbi:hypothetical protein BN1058_01593 [Paraliobacillus sp. PM-2]|uniref:DUF2164 domain-containing protein n=1 Tax=Paraliobacillus sp. PM-2 TaxID=1462524 RepID=UPI00061C6930|nr:DUF2164 domain-containing protein [Paraliobacillus sp. PM-2]CQR47285.1 hypothetical protein BN1058_01593 [Paraliobacillus sp. PM-2]
MSKIISLDSETKQELIKRIQYHFEMTQDQEISELFASFMLDFILKEIAPFIYNQAIEDAYAHVTEKLEDLFEIQKDTKL